MPEGLKKSYRAIGWLQTCQLSAAADRSARAQTSHCTADDEQAVATVWAPAIDERTVKGQRSSPQNERDV
jgi:hypothetical protein